MSADSTEEQTVAPGIAAAMRNVRNADQLSQRHRHRWNLPSDREQHTEGSTNSSE